MEIFEKTSPTTIHLFLDTNSYIRRAFGEWRIAATYWRRARNHSQNCCQLISYRMTREVASTICSIFHCSQCIILVRQNILSNQKIKIFFWKKFIYWNKYKLENSQLSRRLSLLRKDDNLFKLEAINLYVCMKLHIFFYQFWYYQHLVKDIQYIFL